MIKDFLNEFLRYKTMGQKAFDQVSDDGVNRVIGPDNNSIAILVRHVSGNLISRFTDFLTSDGEKSWRDRDSEFADATYDREMVQKMWNDGWLVVESQLVGLSDEDLNRRVTIRGVEFSVHEALCRSVAHVAHHVGQIVLLARICAAGEWQWITIPKGESAQYNLNPTKEKKLD